MLLLWRKTITRDAIIGTNADLVPFIWMAFLLIFGNALIGVFVLILAVIFDTTSILDHQEEMIKRNLFVPNQSEIMRNFQDEVHLYKTRHIFVFKFIRPLIPSSMLTLFIWAAYFEIMEP